MDVSMFVGGERRSFSCEIKKERIPGDDVHPETLEYYLMIIKCGGETLALFLESVADLKLIRNQLQKQIDKEAPDADNE